MSNPLDEIPVLRAHLEEIVSCFQHCQGYQTALDLAEGYRALKPGPRSSRLSAEIARTLERVELYLQTGEEDVADE